MIRHSIARSPLRSFADLLSVRPRFLLVAFSLTGLLFPTLVAAATETESNQSSQLKQLSLEQLGNVEVTTASKTPEKISRTPAAIFVVTQEDIRRSGVTTLPAALRLVPGVEVARIDSNKWSIGIRGFGSRLSRDVLVMIDGRTVYTTLLAGTYWEVQNVMLEDVERIEVIRGPGGTIWGPNALNGVINIITKQSKETHGEFVSAGGGNVDQGFVNARYGGGNDRGLDYRVYGMAFDRGPEYHIDHNNYDSWRAIQGGFRMDWAANSRDNLTFQGDIYDEGAGEMVTAVTYTPPYSQVLRGTEMLSGGNILARWKRVRSENNDLQIQAYYDRTNRREPNFADYRDTFDVDFIDRFPLPGRQEITWGFGARWSNGRNPTIVSGLYFLPGSRTDSLYTLFVQDEIGLIEDRLTFTFGTKLSNTNYTGNQFQPTGRLLWTPTKNQTIWAAFTHALRTPSDAEEAFYLTGLVGSVNGLPFFARFNANPNFHSEELNGYELGYRNLIHENLYVDFASFYNHHGDLFSEDIIGAPYLENNPQPPHYLLPAHFGNGLVGTTRGVEIAPEWRPIESWRLRACYSFLQMEIGRGRNSLDIGTGPIVEGSSPRHQVTATSGSDFKKAFSLDLTYRFVSHLPALKINSYSTADAQFTWRATPNLHFSVVGQNLFQPYHYEYPSDPGPNVGIKRSVYGQISWQR